MSILKPEIPEEKFKCICCQQVRRLVEFQKDAAGARTAWCDDCRHGKVKAWQMEPQELELVYCLYVLERALHDETQGILRNMVNAGRVLDGAHDAQVRIRNHLALQHSRLPLRAREFVEAYRARWFEDIQVQMPVAEEVA